MPTEQERKHLARLMYLAFLDVRILARAGRNEQAKDLAEAFHNIPQMMHTADFSFRVFHDFLKRYQNKYAGQLQFDYLEEWDKMNGNVTA